MKVPRAHGPGDFFAENCAGYRRFFLAFFLAAFFLAGFFLAGLRAFLAGFFLAFFFAAFFPGFFPSPSARAAWAAARRAMGTR